MQGSDGMIHSPSIEAFDASFTCDPSLKLFHSPDSHDVWWRDACSTT
ncbi:hypothetical protein SFR_2500 [Streptomyces sp. FR-008]|nr:hypothetical protein SFR_2500 [Streptomyces sp. FR-008]